MNRTPEYELHYNITEKEHDTQVGGLHDLMRAALHLINPWEVRRHSDGALMFADGDERCVCGNDWVMRGWRVCLSCAEARIMHPNGFTEDVPDQIEGADGVPLEFVLWDLNHLHADW